MIGAFFVLAVAWALVTIQNVRTILPIIVASIVLIIASFANYLLPPIVILGLALCLGRLLFVYVFREKDEWVVVKILAIIAPLCVAVFFSTWIFFEKNSVSIPWWVASYAWEKQQNTDYSLVETVLMGLKNVGSLYLNPFGMPVVEYINYGALIYAVFYVIFKMARGEFTWCLVTVFSVAVLLLYVCLYLFDLIALSPTRHSLVFSIPFYCLVYKSLVEIAAVVNLRETASKALFAVLIFSGVAHLAVSVPKNIALLNGMKETYNYELVRNAAKENGVSLLVTDWWSYNKAYLLFGKRLEEDGLTMKSYGDAKEFPKEPFILFGQNSDIFYGIYNTSNYPKHKAKKLFEIKTDYDNEPSDQVSYWPNKFVGYWVWPK